jgi:hypothetical protein
MYFVSLLAGGILSQLCPQESVKFSKNKLQLVPFLLLDNCLPFAALYQCYNSSVYILQVSAKQLSALMEVGEAAQVGASRL